MSLAEHIRELRNRLIICAVAVIAASVVGWIYYLPLIDYILQPLFAVRDQRGDDLININFPGLTQAFSVQLRTALFVGVILSAPVWIWQIWAFLLPGLTKREKRVATAYFCVSVPLFFTGALLAAWALPRTVAILLSFTPEGAANLQEAMTYLKFVTYFVVAFGLAFLLPVLLVGLNALRILPVRVMISGWRVALMLILVFGALVTPDPSAWTMLALAAPMFALYWCAVGVSALLERRRRRDDPAQAWAGLSPDEPSAL